MLHRAEPALRSRAARAARLAAAALAAFAPGLSHAQSMQSVSDRLARLESSLSAFVASTAASFGTVVAKLDTILASVSEPATPKALASAVVLVNLGGLPENAFLCAVTNVGNAPATVSTYLMRGADGGIVAQSENQFLQPNQSLGAAYTNAAPVLGSAWCKFVPSTPGSNLRGTATVYRLGDGITVTRADAR